MKKNKNDSTSARTGPKQIRRKNWKEERQVLRERWGEQGRQILSDNKKIERIP